MSVNYAPILWNRQKKIYDLVLLVFMVAFLAVFFILSSHFNPLTTFETTLIRATSTLAVLLLHIILAIGPLARINTKFLPLLYNRRHLGVTMFFIALIHGLFSTLQFSALGNKPAIIALFSANTNYTSFTEFPFQVLGFFALLIFFLLAATSHDFWLKNLSPKVWKTLHMFVYMAYALILMHVVLGVVQLESTPIMLFFLVGGFITITLLHLVASFKSTQGINNKATSDWEFVCVIADIAIDCAKVVNLNNENIAIFKYDNKLSAVNNVCKHQNGPLGEGKVVDGCITCPWHGYQYEPHNGTSPPPFDEKVTTYSLKLEADKVFVNPIPFPEGTEVTPIQIPTEYV